MIHRFSYEMLAYDRDRGRNREFALIECYAQKAGVIPCGSAACNNIAGGEAL